MVASLSGERFGAVRAYVGEVVGCSEDAVRTATRFEDGNRHDVYKASYVAHDGAVADLVVRVSLTDDPQERLQVEREAAVLRTLDGVGAPRLIDARLESPWFATPVLSIQFVPGHQFEPASGSPAHLERLGAVVAAVHNIDATVLTDALGSDGTIRAYAESRLGHILRGLPWARDPLPTTLRDGVRRAADVIEQSWNDCQNRTSFDTDEPLALLHGDIALGNVLWNQDPVLIDWEYSRVGDRADEVAYLFDQSGLTSAQRDAFWRGYRRQLPELTGLDVIERVGWWEPLTLLGSTLWWIERWIRRLDADTAGALDPAAPREPDYYIENARTRADRLETLIQVL